MAKTGWKATGQEKPYLDRFNEVTRERLRPLVTKKLIAAYRANPAGPHDDDMERLLNYFRTAAPKHKYAIHAIEPFRQYRVIALSGVPRVPPTPVDDRIYATEDEARIAVFLRRIDDLMNH